MIKIKITNIAVLVLMGMVFFLTSCAKTIYGVPEEQWQKMTDEQKQTAIEGYNERERLREIERQRQAEREAREAEIRAIGTRRQEELRRERIDAIIRCIN